MSITTDKIEVGKYKWFYRQIELKGNKLEGMEPLRTPVLFLHGLPSHPVLAIPT